MDFTERMGPSIDFHFTLKTGVPNMRTKLYRCSEEPTKVKEESECPRGRHWTSLACSLVFGAPDYYVIGHTQDSIIV